MNPFSLLPRSPSARHSAARRRLFGVGTLLALGPSAGLPASTQSKTLLTPRSMPFTLGIASGEPRRDGLLIWTRILPPEFDQDNLPNSDVELSWELAYDEGFKRIAQRASVRALASEAHTVHVDLSGLQEDRWYFYRFHCGAFTSVVGRTRTLPGEQANRLRFAVASCQHYEAGFYAAHRHLAEEALDLVWFVGDYIYE
jgi:alkaline phosphatase D